MENFKERAFKNILTAILLVSASLAQGQWDQRPPSNISETMSYLTTMHRIFPDIFIAATKYNQDIFSFINLNKDIYSNVNRDPDLRRLLRNRGNNLLNLSSKNEVSTYSGENNYAANFQQTWVMDVINILPEYRGSSDSDFKNWLEENIVRNLNSSAYGYSTRILSSLVQLLPQDQRKIDFVSLPVDEILNVLSSRLLYNLPESHFNGKAFGLNQQNLKRDDVLHLLRESLLVERRALLLAQIYISRMNHRDLVVHQGNPLKHNLLRFVQIPFSQQINNGDCTGFECLQDLFKRFNLKPMVLQTLVAQNARQEKRNCPLPQMKSQPPKDAELKLAEVPPIASIMRGFIGSDCATKCSMPYPNSPMEKVFFILDKEGRSKGYMAGTIVETKKGTSFYLHTINGTNLSADNVSFIFEAVLAHTEELGVKAIVLPNDQQLRNLMNSSMIREKFVFYRSAEKTSIEYIDTMIRKIHFDPLSTGSYDKPGDNNYGYMAQQIESDKKSFFAEVTNTPWIHYDQNTISKEDLIESLLFYYLVNGNTNTLEQLLEYSEQSGLNRKSIDFLLRTIKNPDRMSFESYIGEVSKIMAEIGVKVDSNFIDDHWPYFIEGALRSASITEISKRRLYKWNRQAIKSANEHFIFAILMNSDEQILMSEITTLFAKDPKYWRSRPFIKNLESFLQGVELTAENIRMASLHLLSLEVNREHQMCKGIFTN